ncbi:MAG: ribonuclease domain-containing protein [Burkholderiales bacterium]
MKRPWHGWQWLLAFLLLAGWTAVGFARGPVPLPVVRAQQLPVEARETLRLIHAGGPFPYAKDGTVFSNRERLLPGRPWGYYREYTVPTPGSRDRGPRRLISGSRSEIYWTADHYRSFSRVSEGP